MNPFEILGVQPGASADDIRSAYHRLAKQWHPDRFTGQQRVEAEERFRQLAEAFNMVKDAPRREDAVRTAQSVPGSSIQLQDRSEQVPFQEKTAQDWYQDAETAFKNGEYDRALGLVQYAIRQDGGCAEFHALHAKALDKFGGNPRTLVKALETAIRLNHKDIDSTIRLAEIYQSLGMHTRASRLWQAAHNLNPKHPLFVKQGQKGQKTGSKISDTVSESKLTLKEQWYELVEKLKGMFKK